MLSLAPPIDSFGNPDPWDFVELKVLFWLLDGGLLSSVSPQVLPLSGSEHVVFLAGTWTRLFWGTFIRFEETRLLIDPRMSPRLLRLLG